MTLKKRPSRHNLHLKFPNPRLFPAGWLFSLMVGLTLLWGCQRSPNVVTIVVDDQQLQVSTQVETVRAVLEEADITLGPLDRVEPDLNYRLRPVMDIQVIRVMEETEVSTRTIPYEQQTLVNEALQPGETRLAQLGVNGLERLETLVVYENGQPVERTELSRVIAQSPVPEIIVVGRRSDLPSVSFTGTVVYFSGGNAWIMKNSSAARRLLTNDGDLDNRVFDLSPDGNRLLYSRTVTEVIEAPLNQVWLADTLIVGEPPISTPLTGVLYAEWSPVPSETLIAYSTAQRAAGQPGWRANNDLWLWDVQTDFAERQQVVSSTQNSAYAWWGHNYAWSPDGRYIAFATAESIGVVDVVSQSTRTLTQFAPYQTNSDWIWVPTLSWSPDSYFIATVTHGPPIGDEAPTASPRFDVTLLGVAQPLTITLRENAGMWSNPLWHADGLTFGQAVNPLQSVTSRYHLESVDGDGSNERRRFPPPGSPDPGLTFPELASPSGLNDVLFVYQNNLYLLPETQAVPLQLTSNSQTRRPQWVIPPPLNRLAVSTATLTSTLSVTATGELTATD